MNMGNTQSNSVADTENNNDNEKNSTTILKNTRLKSNTNTQSLEVTVTTENLTTQPLNESVHQPEQNNTHENINLKPNTNTHSVESIVIAENSMTQPVNEPVQQTEHIDLDCENVTKELVNTCQGKVNTENMDKSLEPTVDNGTTYIGTDNNVDTTSTYITELDVNAENLLDNKNEVHQSIEDTENSKKVDHATQSDQSETQVNTENNYSSTPNITRCNANKNKDR